MSDKTARVGVDEAELCYAVIIPHYNDVTRLCRCLEALVVQDLSGVEIIVADNATPGGIGEVVERFPQVRFVTQPERGAAAARNMGVAESTAPWLFFLDADCVPAADWLDQARLLAGLDENRISGGQVTVFDETPGPRSGAEAFETVFAFDQAHYVNQAGFSVTANLVTSRVVFERTGPMIAGLSEDIDWCHRATAAGAALVYVPSLVVCHPTRSEWSALVKKWRRITEERFAYLPDTRSARLSWIVQSVLMAPSILVHLPKVLCHQDLSRVERWRGAYTLLKLRMLRMAWMMRQVFVGRI